MHAEYHPSRLLLGIQIFLLILIIIGIGLLVTQKIWVPKLVEYILKDEKTTILDTSDPSNISYMIDGETFTLVHGIADKKYDSDSVTTETLSMFGEPTYGDLDTDGDTDAAILLVHNPGGSGTFYYAVLAILSESGYRATETMYLGDRIAPQTIEIHDGRAVFNFAERRADESMSTQPSMGRSVWVHYNTETNEIGEWVKDFEGESNAISTTTQPLLLQNTSSIEKTALLANGCFWCVEHDLEEVQGVIDVVSGYAGGTNENPTYKNYGDSGHREVVLVTYDTNIVTFANLVEHIIKHGDPTDAFGSFGDRGIEYAPAIYYETEAEKNHAYTVITAIDASHVFPESLPLVVIPRVQFWPAEEYHQDYSEKNPLRYNYYRKASGRDAFIEKHWGETANIFTVSTEKTVTSASTEKGVASKEGTWELFVKPSDIELRNLLTPIQYEVTQEEGTERPFKNEYDKNVAEGIYVDIVSGEPLYSSKDKYDSGTGWPSFVKPISDDTVTLKEDNGLFTKRTEVRSRYADSHLGHVFDDGPADQGGKRYCMNSASLRFIPKEDMEKEGYAYLLDQI